MKALLRSMATVTVLVGGWACSSGGDAEPGTGGSGAGSGGSTSGSGGGTGPGGRVGTGGATTGSGGTPGSGGSAAAGSGGVGTGGRDGAATGGTIGSSGGSGTGGMTSAGGRSASGGTTGVGGTTGSGGASATGGAGGGSISAAKFSFFVTSLESMRKLSTSQDGFGGDLKFGKADGLTGADEICRQVAELGMPGAGMKQWRAFLSAVKGPDGAQVNAIDRVGNGPWYDRMGRIVAMTKADLVQNRPRGADPAIIDNLPNENGIPNRTDTSIDNHDTMTGSKSDGTLAGQTATCSDWTSAVGDRATTGQPQLGHSWPQQGSGTGWIQAHLAGGCAPSVAITQAGGITGVSVGSAGGYGGIYCLALMP